MTTPVEVELHETDENSVNSSDASESIADNDSDRIIQNETVKLSPAHYCLFFILFLLLYACYNILYPYMHTIILAIILATVFKPVHRKIKNRFGRRESLAALLSCILLTMVVVLPLTLILISLIRQGTQSFHAISEWIAAGKFNQLMELPNTRFTRTGEIGFTSVAVKRQSGRSDNRESQIRSPFSAFRHFYHSDRSRNRRWFCVLDCGIAGTFLGDYDGLCFPDSDCGNDVNMGAGGDLPAFSGQMGLCAFYFAMVRHCRGNA